MFLSLKAMPLEENLTIQSLIKMYKVFKNYKGACWIKTNEWPMIIFLSKAIYRKLFFEF